MRNEFRVAGGRDNPDNHVMLPFTRMLAGRMDYTPGGFDNVTRTEFEPRMRKPMVMGTRAHHSGDVRGVRSADPDGLRSSTAYEGQPSFEFIKSVPATWDETRVLYGVPGEYITIARRHGDEWFVGSMCNWTPRQFEIPLSFLSKGRYTAEIYADAADADRFPKHVVIEKKTVDSGKRLKIQLAPAGGFAMRLRPAR